MSPLPDGQETSGLVHALIYWVVVHKGDAAMYLCVLCKFEVVLDDAIAITKRGNCVCIRCYARETDTQHPIPTALRRELEETMTPQG